MNGAAFPATYQMSGALSADGSLDVDIPAVQVRGNLRVNGQP